MNFSAWLRKIEEFNNRISEWFEWIGIVALLLVVVITGIDVIGAKLFTWRLLGAIDIVTLSQLIAIAFATSCALIVGRHVKVEFLVSRFPPRLQAFVNSIVSLLGLALFIIIAWRLTTLGYSFQNSGEASPTIYIPLYPLAYGAALACVPVCLVYLVELLKSILTAVGK